MLVVTQIKKMIHASKGKCKKYKVDLLLKCTKKGWLSIYNKQSLSNIQVVSLLSTSYLLQKFSNVKNATIVHIFLLRDYMHAPLCDYYMFKF